MRRGGRWGGGWGVLLAVLGLVGGQVALEAQAKRAEVRGRNFSASAEKGRANFFGPQPFFRMEGSVRLEFLSGPHRVRLRAASVEGRMTQDLTIQQAEAQGPVQVEVWTQDPATGQPAQLFAECARVLYEAKAATVTLYADPKKPTLLVYHVKGEEASRVEVEFSREFVLDLSEASRDHGDSH